MMKIFIKEKIKLSTDFQPFMQDFVAACIEGGMRSKPDILPSYRFHIRSLLNRLLLLLFRLEKMCFPILSANRRKKKALFIASNGGMILQNAFPYYYSYEIVPMLWDMWPHSWDKIYRDIRLLGIRTVFVTVRQFAEQLRCDLNIEAFWIPEGINVLRYISGKHLKDRPNDLIEIGRQHPDYHRVVSEMSAQGKLIGYQTSRTNEDGTLRLSMLAFPRLQDMLEAIPQYKIMVCFPQCDTNPQRAGNLETLTQRYWEAMLSRCLMIGRAPRELTDLIGYDPVIAVDWNQPETQLAGILKHIETYQQLVDKNFQTACEKAPWKSRAKDIQRILKVQGYDFQ